MARIHRRSFLHVGTASLLGLSLADVLRGESTTAVAAQRRATASSVIMVWLGGGPATIDMWDMKSTAPVGVRGEFQPISTAVPGVQICEYLPKLAGVLDHCTLVRSVHHTIAAHGPGSSYLMTGNRPNAILEHPSLGSLACRTLSEPRDVPSYVTLGRQPNGAAGFLGAAYNPYEAPGFEQLRDAAPHTLPVSLPNGFSVADLGRRAALMRELDEGFRRFDGTGVADNLSRFHQRAIDILRSDRTRQALDLSTESDSRVRAYGRGAFGRSALAARRLIESGVRFVTIGLNGWDTHINNFGQLRNLLLPQLDGALAALVVDLKDRGLLESTIIYCTGEFGRTPHVNGRSGRDHWSRSMCQLLAGGGFRAGYAHGATDLLGGEPTSGGCSPDDVSATIFDRLGIPPDHTVRTRSGRPVSVFRNGSVVRELVSDT